MQKEGSLKMLCMLSACFRWRSAAQTEMVVGASSAEPQQPSDSAFLAASNHCHQRDSSCPTNCILHPILLPKQEELATTAGKERQQHTMVRGVMKSHILL